VLEKVDKVEVTEQPTLARKKVGMYKRLQDNLWLEGPLTCCCKRLAVDNIADL
jgi:hypothetical protein